MCVVFVLSLFVPHLTFGTSGRLCFMTVFPYSFDKMPHGYSKGLEQPAQF